jgi:predicted kinase
MNTDLGKSIVEELLEELRQADLQEEMIREGVYDPGKLKAVFLAGGPGSGKTAVTQEIFGVPNEISVSGGGLKYVGSDYAFEKMMKRAGYGTKLDKLDDETFKKITSDEPGSIRSDAKRLVTNMMNHYISGRLGIIVDGTGHNPEKIKRQAEMLKSMGYDLQMVFVNTSLEKALDRNKKRDRTLPSDIVKQKWEIVQHNIGKLKEIFGNNFSVVDNNEDIVGGKIKIPDGVNKEINKFIREPIKNPFGKKWIQRELELKRKPYAKEKSDSDVDKKTPETTSKTTQSSSQESDAAKDAKKRGLIYKGFGRWADKSNTIVAKSENGKLVKIEESLSESKASEEAKRKGLEYDAFGRWKDKSGNVVAKTKDDKLIPIKSKEVDTKSSSKLASTDKKLDKKSDKETDSKINSKIKTLVGVYSGRFQPFGMHHFQAYNQLKGATGANTFIATSNVVDKYKSPFTFGEKQKIISKYGVPSSKVVKTKSPYKPVEILEKFDPATTALVVSFGQKDADRLSGGGDYYKPFKSVKTLEGYEKHGYYIIAKHESVVVGGKELSGTAIRGMLGSHKISKEKKIPIFKKIFGWFDKDVFEMIVDRLEGTVSEAIRLSGLLLEGGAAGHMQHIFDDMQLTFGDLKNIVRLSLQGELSKEGGVTEKLDGQALAISWKDGKLIAARNKGHLKNHGAAAPDANGIKDMFAGRGAVADAFGLAMDDLQNAVNSLSEKQKKYVFDNGKNFMNLEIIYPKNANVIPYDTSLLVFHGVSTYDENGNVINQNKEFARMLAGMIKQVNQNVQKTYTIESPTFLTIPKYQDFSVKQNYFIKKIDALKSKFPLKDTDTVSVYHQMWWEDFIGKKAKSVRYSLPNNVLAKLVMRWAFYDKSNKITDIKKEIDNDRFAEWVDSFDKNDTQTQVKENMLPFEKIFLELGATVLENASGFIAANPNKVVQKIRKDLDKAVSKLKNSTDPNDLQKLKLELERIRAIGGFDKIMPSEGLVFVYKGKTFKLTGSFAPINQLIGILRYGR